MAERRVWMCVCYAVAIWRTVPVSAAGMVPLWSCTTLVAEATKLFILIQCSHYHCRIWAGLLGSSDPAPQLPYA